MDMASRFAPGDKAWCLDGYEDVRQLTVGLVRVEIVDSTGLNGGYVESGIHVAFDNYKPRKSRKEEYMMVETGIGSGNVYTLGAHVFSTREEAESAMARRIEERDS